ncbi:hypothetical protein DOLIC_00112 [Dolichomitus sp. PSUC_FEM 10030005]|nr:hypothetical protein [Dolichomitus sp. PSUC_FEM 10030005]
MTECDREATVNLLLDNKNKYDIRCFENKHLIISYQLELYQHWHKIIFTRECRRIIQNDNNGVVNGYNGGGGGGGDVSGDVMTEACRTTAIDNLLKYSNITDNRINDQSVFSSIQTFSRKINKTNSTTLAQRSNDDNDEDDDDSVDALENYATVVTDIDIASADVFKFFFVVAGKYRAFANTLDCIIDILRINWHLELWGLLPEDFTRISIKLAYSAQIFFSNHHIDDKKKLAYSALRQWLKLRLTIRMFFLRIHKQIIPAFIFYDMTVIKTYIAIIHNNKMPMELVMTFKTAQRLLNTTYDLV